MKVLLKLYRNGLFIWYFFSISVIDRKGQVTVVMSFSLTDILIVVISIIY